MPTIRRPLVCGGEWIEWHGTLEHSEVHSKRTVNANKLIIGRDGGSGGGGSGGGSVQQCELH